MERETINYIGVLTYFENNQEIPYSNPEREGISAEEKRKLLDIKEKGKKAVNEMKKMADQAKRLYGLDKCLPGSWLDGSNTKTRKYLWTQMKYADRSSNLISISIFVERNGTEPAYYRVSLEIKNDGADKAMIDKYHTHLDIPRDVNAGLVYVSGNNEWGHPEVLQDSQEQIKVRIASGKLRKVQICKFIEQEQGKTNEYYNHQVMTAIHDLLPYYNHVVEKNDKDEYWPSLDEYDPGITKEQWIELLQNEKITITENLKMFKMMLHLGGESTCANLAEIFGGTANSYNGLGRGFGDRVYRKTGCPLYIDEGQKRLYIIPFVGRNVIEKGKSRYSWKLRTELKEALEEMDISNIDVTIKENTGIKYDKNIILYGPPGTGKTYSSAIYAVAICDGIALSEVKVMNYYDVMERYEELMAVGRIAFTTFHQSYGYEEFIEGIKPDVSSDGNDIRYILEPGVFKKFCDDARRNTEPSVFIIDEINRGNISKIFGELITLIEDTKREGMDEGASAILPYSRKPFSVPENVYILGTMNTADRSIALMDTALRRRFQFVEMMPDTKVLRDLGADKVQDLDVAAMLDKINERISLLYDREHTIGHAFFTRLAQNSSIEVLQSIFEKSVIPLLQEYFYEDYQKIQLVLGDNGKTDNSLKFILDKNIKVKDIFKGSVDDVIDLPEKTYSINSEAFSKLESYKEIM